MKTWLTNSGWSDTLAALPLISDFVVQTPDRIALHPHDLFGHLDLLVDIARHLTLLALGIAPVAIKPVHFHFFNPISGFFKEIQELNVKGCDLPAGGFLFLLEKLETGKDFHCWSTAKLLDWWVGWDLALGLTIPIYKAGTMITLETGK